MTATLDAMVDIARTCHDQHEVDTFARGLIDSEDPDVVDHLIAFAACVPGADAHLQSAV